MAKVIAVLGGGSVWTPHLIERIAGLPLATDLQIRIQGPTESHLQEVASFTRRLTRDRIDIKVTLVLADAISDASIVLNQARIGGWCERLNDEILPVQLGMIGDESLGVGGLRAAIRTWPFVLEASKIILEYAPGAWVLNMTNPSDLVARAWRKAGCQKVVSLCDQPQTLMLKLATAAGRADAAVRFGFIGMTHVGWLMPPPDITHDEIVERFPELIPWLQKWKAIPTPWRVHLSSPAALFRQQQQCPGYRARQLKELASEVREVTRRQDTEQYRVLLMKRFPVWHSEVVVPAIRGLLGGEAARLIVGLPNKVNLPDLDYDVQVEGWAVLDSGGVHPEPYPENARCREDIVRFGQSRAVDFDAMLNPASYLDGRLARSDAFINFSSIAVDWRELLAV